MYKVLVGNPEGKRRLGRPRCRWEDGITMDLRETGLGGVDWIRLAQDRDRWRAVVSAVMNLRVSSSMYLSPKCSLLIRLSDQILFAFLSSAMCVTCFIQLLSP
jgi:hypothetical protein